MTPFSYLICSFVALCKGEWSDYNKELAIMKDEYGNILCKYIFNFFLRKKQGYKFGVMNETISSAIGKNKMDGTLTFIGRFVDYVLDCIEPNHSIKAVHKKN